MEDTNLFNFESSWEEITQGQLAEESLCDTDILGDIKQRISEADLYMDIDDVKKAYDNVNLDILSQDIMDMSTLTKGEIQNALSIIDEWRNLDYDLGGGIICRRTRGIPQSSPASPMMFALYYAKCVSKAKEKVEPIIWDSVMLLTFADNNVIIGKKQLRLRGLFFGTGSTILTKESEKIVRILGHRVVWSKGNIIGLDQSITNQFLKQQQLMKLDTYPPYIGIRLFKTFILSVLRFHVSGMIIFRQIDKGKSWWKHLYGEMNKLIKRYITTPKDEQCYMTARGISFLKLVQKYGDQDIIDEYLKTIPKQVNFKIKFPIHYNIDNIDIKLNEYTSFTSGCMPGHQ